MCSPPPCPNDCKVSPQKRTVEKIREPTPEPIVKRKVVKRNPTPLGDIFERITVKREPQQIIELLTQQPRKPSPKIIYKTETEPCPPPITVEKCVFVDPSLKSPPPPPPKCCYYCYCICH